jgi:hypothetical protein
MNAFCNHYQINTLLYLRGITVDDCSWVISFTKENDFQERATALLDQVNTMLGDHGYKMDQAKTKVAWIFAGEKA